MVLLSLVPGQMSESAEDVTLVGCTCKKVSDQMLLRHGSFDVQARNQG